MKKNYLFTLLLSLCFSAITFGQTPIITAIVDGDCSGGNPKLLEIYAKGTVDFTLYSLENQTNANTTWGNAQDLSSFGTVTDKFVYISTSGSAAGLTSDFPSITSVLATNTMNINGDDRLRIVLTSDSSVIDQFGAEGTDGSGTTWEYEDSYAKRKNATGPDAGFTEANWVFGGKSFLNNLGVCQNGDSADTFATLIGGIATYTTAVSTEPSISISSPTNNAVFPGSTTEVPAILSIENFTLSGDDGSEMSDNTGDGYILGTLEEIGETPSTKNLFTTTPEPINVEPGKSYNLTVELVDNSGSSLSPKVEVTISFSIELPCDLQLGTIDTTCDATTSGVDTYSGTIAFTGGNTGYTYTITAPGGVTIGGDNPSTSSEGVITFTGMTEGVDADITIVGGTGSSCDFSRTLYSPACISLPISEDFSYADGSLIDNPLWSNFSGTLGDLMVTSGQVLVKHGASEDAQIQFTSVSGSLYYAIDFTVVDPGAPISGDDNEYFAMFKDNSFGFTGRLDIVPPTATGDFSVGIASAGSTADSVWATDLTYGVNYRATVKYDQDNNIAQLWIDAAQETETSILGADLEGSGPSIVAFALRQSDSDLNEGILVDNLRIGTTFAETSLSAGKIEIEGFSTYPNPVTNDILTITTKNSSEKLISIFNVLGKKVFSSSFSGVKSTIDVSSMATGLYILKVTEGTKTATSKLVIR